MWQFGLQHRVTRKWAKELDDKVTTIKSWTGDESEKWVSNLPFVGSPPSKASITESGAYVERKKAWDKQYAALQKLAGKNSCDLMPV